MPAPQPVRDPLWRSTLVRPSELFVRLWLRGLHVTVVHPPTSNDVTVENAEEDTPKDVGRWEDVRPLAEAAASRLGKLSAAADNGVVAAAATIPVRPHTLGKKSKLDAEYIF